MTKFNWEKAAKNDRYYRLVFAKDRPADKPLELELPPGKRTLGEFDNPLGLTEDDCVGRVPALEKREQIAALLLHREADLKEAYGLNNGVPIADAVKKVSRNFNQFCRLVALAETNPERNFWPLAVCYGVFYLHYYNTVIAAKGEKVPCLTWEIWERVSSYRQAPSAPILSDHP